MSSRGLNVSLDDLRLEGAGTGRYIDLACVDTAADGLFALVAADVVAAVRAPGADVVAATEEVLARWRWFWSAPPRGLSDEEQVGLLGELYFLEFWAGPVDGPILAAWTGPAGDRHDFKSPAVSVEVKATRVRADGAATHRIASLDQLDDPETGVLLLFSLQVQPDPIATHSLAGAIDRLRAALRSQPHLLDALDEKLARAGYSPMHHAKYTSTFRIIAERLFTVAPGFPRLTRGSFPDGLPAGVDHVQYSLDLVGAAAFQLADSIGVESRRMAGQLRGVSA